MKKRATTGPKLTRTEIEQQIALVRSGWTDGQRRAMEAVRRALLPFTAKQIETFHKLLTNWVDSFVWACQLPGTPVILLDNSVIQDFKHAGTSSDKGGLRQARATALVAFSHFLDAWNGRGHAVAISPVAVYEHLGRKPLVDRQGAVRVLQELNALLEPTKQRLQLFNASSVEQFVEATQAIQHDADLLFSAACELGEGVWARDLKAPFGAYIPLGIAEDATPRDLPLRYFSPRLVHHVFSARVEQDIISQSMGVSSVKPISSGAISERLAGLNGLKRDLRKGKIQGLGDLEILQFCSVRHQHLSPATHVFVGLCSDSGLQDLLHDYSNLVVSRRIEGGVSTAQEVQDVVEMMLGLSKPFNEEDTRLAAAIPAKQSFKLAILDVYAEIPAVNAQMGRSVATAP